MGKNTRIISAEALAEATLGGRFDLPTSLLHLRASGDLIAGDVLTLRLLRSDGSGVQYELVVGGDDPPAESPGPIPSTEPTPDEIASAINDGTYRREIDELLDWDPELAI